MQRPTAGLEGDLARQRDFIARSVPVYARLLDLLSAALDTDFRAELDAAWSRRTFGVWYERPLLLLAALRAAALHEGRSHPLADGLGATEPNQMALTRGAFETAIAPNQTFFWQCLRERAVQTNEVSRAVAWLWPASIVLRRLPGVPVDLHDIGASAGLNLLGDELPWPWTDLAGNSLVTEAPRVGRRKAYDRAPLDPSDPSVRLWLRACIWPGHTERLEVLEAAFGVFDRLRARGEAPEFVTATARETPSVLETPQGAAAIAYQTVMRGYLGSDESEAYEEGMRAWLRRAPGRALWIELEPTRLQDEPDLSTVVTAHVARESAVQSLEIARCHPHPRRLRVDPDAVARLEALVQ